MQRLVKVDGKVRTDCTYPAGFMDVIEIDRTDEHFRLIYDTKGRFVTHRITKVGCRSAALMIHKSKNVSWHNQASPYWTTCLAVKKIFKFLRYDFQPADGPHWGKAPQW